MLSTSSCPLFNFVKLRNISATSYDHSATLLDFHVNKSVPNRRKFRFEETKLIDDPMSFLSVNPNRVIVLHYDAPVLILCISGFDVHRVLVDPGSATDLLQLPTFNQMKLS